MSHVNDSKTSMLVVNPHILVGVVLDFGVWGFFIYILLLFCWLVGFKNIITGRC